MDLRAPTTDMLPAAHGAGVADVLSFGGDVKQYQVWIPD
jgi:hypothetical protein